jgi:hypothetical protein
MRTIQIRALSFATLAFLMFAGNAAAQDRSPAILNSLEVQQLVNRAEPGDNARLAAHFTALADGYVAEAKRHIAMSKGFTGNPNHQLETGMSVHCKQLADLNTQSATELRELATYHQKLAAGAIATPPTVGTSFKGGAGAPAPTDQELSALAAKAITPADHHSLEEYFLTSAKRYTADANQHSAMANTYRGTKIAQAAAHCDRLVTLSRAEAKEATAAAAMHKQLAALGR